MTKRRPSFSNPLLQIHLALSKRTTPRVFLPMGWGFACQGFLSSDAALTLCADLTFKIEAVELQIHRLKLMKRHLHIFARRDLLQIRLLLAA
jgi:hypothetical protein